MQNFSVSEGVVTGAEQIEALPFKNKDIQPRYILLHYTGGGSLDSSIKYLRKKGYSYQLLVDRDGHVVQGTPLTKRASHAGYSNWKGLDSLNDFSIGISLANLGYLDKYGTKYYRTNSHGDPSTAIFDQSEVTKARHWNGHNGSTAKGWEPYTEAQYRAVNELCEVLLDTYPSLVDVISHEEVAIGRKPDPGMAFDWKNVRNVFLNRQLDLGPEFRVNVGREDTLNVRKGPNGSWGISNKLSNESSVHIRSYAYVYKNGTPVKSSWASVALKGDMQHYGFVQSKHLRAV